eukprot:52661-Eustigmatos_ZCMA.PRE.1
MGGLSGVLRTEMCVYRAVAFVWSIWSVVYQMCVDRGGARRWSHAWSVWTVTYRDVCVPCCCS